MYSQCKKILGENTSGIHPRIHHDASNKQPKTSSEMTTTTTTTKMPYRYLGKSGLYVSVFSLGAWATYGLKSGEEECYQCMKVAFEAGVNFFDNAEAYGENIGDAEIVMGRALKRLGWKRSDYVISTKIFFGGNGKNDRGVSIKHLIEGVNKSLERLQLSYVDLIFAHRPDYATPMEEIVRGFTHLINSGKALYWGTSEWTSQQLTEAYWIAKINHLIPPTMEQPEYNMFHRERVEKEYLPLYQEPYGLGTTIWSPLKSGVLTGKYNKGIPEGSRLAHKNYAEMLKGNLEHVPKVIELEKIAQELGCSVGNLAIAWCALNPHVSTVILGASNVDQIKENLLALDVIPKLTPPVIEKIEAILNNKPKPEVTFGRDLH